MNRDCCTPNVATPAITVRDVNVQLAGQNVLSNVNAEFPSGELTALIGPNGAGKTTLLKVLLDQLPHTGQVRFTQVNGHAPRIGYVPQSLDFDRGAPIRVVDVMCSQLQHRALWLGISSSARKAAAAALDRIGASKLLDRRLGQLSGGELQRVLLAMALLLQPDVLLLDEPVAGVDMAGVGMFCDILATLQRELKCTMVLVSHDMSVTTSHASYVVCMNKTVHCQGRTIDTLTPENLQAIYGPLAALHHHAHSHEGAGHSHGAHDHPDLHGHHHNH